MYKIQILDPNPIINLLSTMQIYNICQPKDFTFHFIFPNFLQQKNRFRVEWRNFDKKVYTFKASNLKLKIIFKKEDTQKFYNQLIRKRLTDSKYRCKCQGAQASMTLAEVQLIWFHNIMTRQKRLVSLSEKTGSTYSKRTLCWTFHLYA